MVYLTSVCHSAQKIPLVCFVLIFPWGVKFLIHLKPNTMKYHMDKCLNAIANPVQYLEGQVGLQTRSPILQIVFFFNLSLYFGAKPFCD